MEKTTSIVSKLMKLILLPRFMAETSSSTGMGYSREAAHGPTDRRLLPSVRLPADNHSFMISTFLIKQGPSGIIHTCVCLQSSGKVLPEFYFPS